MVCEPGRRIGIRFIAVVVFAAASVAITMLVLSASAAYAFTWTSASGSPYRLGGYPTSVATGDFNGDGLPDIAVGTNFSTPANPNGSAEVFLLLAGGDGFGGGSSEIATLGGGGPSVTTADFNADGKLDLAASCDGGVWILIGNGDGAFSPTSASPISDGHGALRVVTGDFNGDGKPDLAILNQDDTVSVLLGNGDGTFRVAPGSPITAGTGTGVAIAVGDFTGDGNRDLAVLSTAPGPTGSSGELTVLLGNGNGTFRPAPGSPTALSASPNSLAVADFTSDGKTDIAITADAYAASSSSGQLIVLLGRGDGSFTPATGSPIPVPAGSLDGVAAADFNDDGNQDIASGFRSNSNAGANGVYLLLGDGTGQFRAARGSPFPLNAPEPVTAGPDVLATTTTDGRVALILSPGYSGPAGELYALLAPLRSDPPTARLALSESTAFAGTRVRLDASGSTDPLDRPIVDYRWDLGSGRFPVNTGPTPTLTHRFSTSRAYTVRVQVRNSVGETAIATARLTVSPPRNAVISGYVQLCAGPAAGRCRISTIRVCYSHHRCVTSDRLAVIDSRRRHVALVKLHRARFSLRLASGAYTLELLGDGSRIHGRVMQRSHVIARAHRTTTVRFVFDVP